MNQTLAVVVVLALLVVVVVVGVLAARGRFRGSVKGPGGMGATVEGERASGVRVRKVRAGRDVTGRGLTVDARGVDAGRDATFEDRSDPGPEG